MATSSFDLEGDPFFDDFDIDPGVIHATTSSSSTSLDPASSLPPRAASLDTLRNRIEQRALHAIYNDAAAEEVPWTLDSS